MTLNSKVSAVQMSRWLMSWEILCGKKKCAEEKGRSGGFCKVTGVSEVGETPAVQRRNCLVGGVLNFTYLEKNKITSKDQGSKQKRGNSHTSSSEM